MKKQRTSSGLHIASYPSIPKNISRNHNREINDGDYYIYDAILGCRIMCSDSVEMPRYSGLAGLRAHYSVAMGDCTAYMPFTPPTIDDSVTYTSPEPLNSTFTESEYDPYVGLPSFEL